MKENEAVLVEKRGHVTIVTLNRPEIMNAFDQAMMVTMTDIFNGISDDKDCRVMVLTGAGGNFTSGGDVRGLGLESLTEKSAVSLWRDIRQFQHRFQTALANVSVPTIAAMEGVAIGGGLDMALCCDIRIGATDTRMGERYAQLGVIPGNGACTLLSAILGYAKAAELIFTGRIVKGPEAVEMGLINQVVESGEALNTAIAMAETIAANAPLAVQFSKEILVTGHRNKLIEEMRQIAPLVGVLQQTSDFAEGASAIMQKRKPEFTAE